MLTIAAIALLLSRRVDAVSPPPIHQDDIVWMLNLEDVRQDLKLDAQQRKALDAVIETTHVALPDLDDLTPAARKKKIDELLDKADLNTTFYEALARVFTPEQRARYAQLKLQFRGVDALRLKSVAKALSFTDKQRRSIQEQFAAVRSIKPGNAQIKAEQRNAVWDVLTPEQEAQWERLVGPSVGFEGMSRDDKPEFVLTSHWFLLRKEEVAKDLRLSKEQRARLAILVDKMAIKDNLRSLSLEERQRELADRRPRMMRQLEELTLAGLARILTSEQLARYAQLELQRMGNWQIAEASTADRLGLTDAQREKIEELRNSNPRPGPRPRPTREEMQAWRDRGERIRREVYEVLTPEQKEKWEGMLGPRLDEQVFRRFPSIYMRPDPD